MVDIHTHIIHKVDDGSKNISSSIAMLETAKNDGTTDIICTPHYRQGSFETPKEIIIENFNELKLHAEKIGLNLYLGQEIATNKVLNTLVKNGKVLTLNNSKYVLVEFDYNNFVDISNICYELKVSGFIPVIAHIERYTYVKIEDVEEFIGDGALIQINASSLLGGIFSKYRKKVVEYLKRDFVHFVASDIHSGREYNLQKAYQVVAKKYGCDRASKLFIENGKKLLQNEIIK